MPLAPANAQRAAIPATPGRRARWVAAGLFCLLAVVYVANLRNVGTGDTAAVRYVPFSILNRHSLNVDGYIDRLARPYLDGTIPYGVYFATRARGHWMSSYPLLTPVVVTPLYVVPAWWVEHKHIAPDSDAMLFLATAMDKLSGALLAALSVAIFYLAVRRVLPSRSSLLLTLVYGLASPTWTVSSQALWLHGLTEVSFALLLWALLADDGSNRSAFWIGLALALAVANKLTNGVVALPVIIWFCWRALRGDPTLPRAPRLTAFFAPLVALGSLVLVYNLYYFGSMFGAYEQAFQTLGYAGIGSGLHGSLLQGVAGMLVSPSRGLFVYVPWTLLALWGAVRLFRDREHGWEPWLIAGALLNFLCYAKLERWYAGYTYGPRYCTDIMPILAFCLVPLWQTASRMVLRTVLAATVALALAVQGLGAFCYPNGDWNAKPINVDLAPQRVWDWRDPQILRTLRAGPAPSKLLDHLRGVHHYDDAAK